MRCESHPWVSPRRERDTLSDSTSERGEDSMDWTNVLKLIESTITRLGLQVLGAIVLYIVGRWLISFAVGLVQKGLSQQKIEPTLLRFIGNTISVILNI